MNWRQGLFRVWIFFSALWVIGAACVAWAEFSRPHLFADDFQYLYQLKDSNPLPWKIDWTKPLYELISSPGKGKFPDEFSPVGKEYIETWRKDERLEVIKFPDSSSLYLSKDFTEDDKKYLSRIFWENRWGRYFQKVVPYLLGAILPPLILLLIGISSIWVIKGFTRKPSVS